MICDRCGQDRVRFDTWIMAFPRAGWPPVKFERLCPGCRYRLRWPKLHRALFLVCCLALAAAVAATGVGIVYLIQWVIRQSFT